MAKKEGRWAKIIEEVARQLQILRARNLRPSLREMHYIMSDPSVGLTGNTKNEYKELSRQTARAREDGRLDPDCFVDKGRAVVENGYHSDAVLAEPEVWAEHYIGKLRSLDKDYPTLALCKWYNQKHYVEIWIEKEAQEERFVNALKGRDVRIVPNKGYSSFTFINKNCERLRTVKAEEPRKKIHIRYFGDMDPSGDDMDRDIIERIERLTGWTHGVEFEFKRVAVTHKQISEYDLPPMPTDEETVEKYQKDPRREKYEAKNNHQSIAVELEALSINFPEDYEKMIQDAANEFYDERIYDKEIKRRSTPEFRKKLRQQVYDAVKEFLDDYIDGDDNPDVSEDAGL